MTVVDLLEHLGSNGIEVRVHAGDLKLKPRGKVTPQILSETQRLKLELLAFLQAENTPPALREYPGIDLNGHGLWIYRGQIMPTRGTMPAYTRYFHVKSASPDDS